ncbi:DUF427 domain-containing protein [Hankyongella ginsenosidimutans]|uniref:DUF427 domain-containing protein n=1 Tax=Hankyongella ginsenosidimutans TaxID=1763828 RepID=A0A4D7CA11_9SPHN|nr:DUF427 domain-containing protein [Hankyongella ginsenosidimutans]QCI79973.1 DUF427 domain-containing protein [Hankyongella ginsenosidimutans]
MMEARWNGQTIARSDATVVVEGNHYFPIDSVNPVFLKPSGAKTVCPWKGTAHYYTLVAGGAENADAAWYYPETKPEAAHIRGYVAFWRGVTVSPA